MFETVIRRSFAPPITTFPFPFCSIFFNVVFNFRFSYWTGKPTYICLLNIGSCSTVCLFTVRAAKNFFSTTFGFNCCARLPGTFVYHNAALS